jgi:hypothetical protein
MPLRVMSIACGGGTLAESYENTMFRLERIARDGYNIEVK